MGATAPPRYRELKGTWKRGPGAPLEEMGARHPSKDGLRDREPRQAASGSEAAQVPPEGPGRAWPVAERDRRGGQACSGQQRQSGGEAAFYQQDQPIPAHLWRGGTRAEVGLLTCHGACPAVGQEVSHYPSLALSLSIFEMRIDQMVSQIPLRLGGEKNKNKNKTPCDGLV